MRRSAILTYHSLDESGSVISLSPRVFREQMRWLAESGVPVVPLDQVTRQRGSIALTFDDGFRNFAEHAAPVLAEHGFPSTLFVVSEYAGKTNDWPSQPAWVPRMPLLDWAELRSLKGVEIGNHTASHPDLSRLDAASASREIDGAHEEIEQRIGRAVREFAYPYGKAAPTSRYGRALGTRLAYLDERDDPLELPRLDAYYFRSLTMFRQIPRTAGSAWVRLRALARRA